MTDYDLDTMQTLWGNGVSAKEIASLLGYSEGHVMHTAVEYRERFPRRRSKIDDEEIAWWVRRIVAGRATTRDAAESMSVCLETIRRRVRAYRRHMDDEARLVEEEGEREA